MLLYIATGQLYARIIRARYVDLLIENVELLGRCVLLQQLGRHLALGCKYNTVLGEDTDSCSGVGNGLERILDLIEAPIGGEDGRLGTG